MRLAVTDPLGYGSRMFGLGMGELLVILAVALLVLGPKRLPEIATGLGKAIRDFRRATRDLQDQIEVDESVRKPIAELRAALRDEPLPPPRVVIGPPASTVPVLSDKIGNAAPLFAAPPAIVSDSRGNVAADAVEKDVSDKKDSAA